MKNSKLKFYYDTLILEESLSNKFNKQAGIGSNIVSAVKDYFSSKIDPDNRVGSFINLISPGVIYQLFNAIMPGKFSILATLVMTTMNIDLGSLLTSIWEKFKSALSTKSTISNSEVDSIVSSSVQQHASQKLSSIDFNDAQLFKLALYGNKEAILKLAYDNKKTSVLTTILSTIFKVAASAALFNVAGDLTNKALGRPNSFDGTIQHGKEVKSIPPPSSKQTKFKPNPSYFDNQISNWSENVTNNNQSISNMLVRFAKEVYTGLDGKESIITASNAFQEILKDIVWNNHEEGAPFVNIPEQYKSKKQIVDYFIDYVAGMS